MSLTIFLNQFTNTFNLKNPNKNMALANLSIYYTWKTFNLNTTTINLKFLLQLRMMNLIYLVYLILFLIFNIILIMSSKDLILLQIILLFKLCE